MLRITGSSLKRCSLIFSSKAFEDVSLPLPGHRAITCECGQDVLVTKVLAPIHAEICLHGFDANLNSFVQYYGCAFLDASLLLIPQVGFLPAKDLRVIGTIAAVERGLIRNGFVLRYSTDEIDDGIGGEEGAFLACSFWLADAYVMVGRYDDAVKLFDRLLAIRNDLSLLAEEYDFVRNRLVGNFPQGFSHIGLINTAYNLIDTRGPAQQRAQCVQPVRLGRNPDANRYSGL